VRGETEYRISIVPLGGYVRMYGDDPSEDVPDAEKKRAFLWQPFWKKSLIAIAGPVANFALPIALFFAMNVGHEHVAAAVVGAVLPDEPAAKAGIAPGDRIVAIGGTPIAVFSDMQSIVGPRAGVPLRVTVERLDGRHEIEVVPRAEPDPSIFDRTRTIGRLGIVANVEEPAVVVAHGSVAARAGIKDLDRITAVDGKPVHDKRELFAALDAGGTSLDVTTPATKDAAAVSRKVTLTAEPGAPEIGFAKFAVTAEELPSVQAKIDATRAVTADALATMSKRFGLGPVDGSIEQVQDETAAAELGIVAHRDRIVAVDGKPFLTLNDLRTSFEPDPNGIHVIGVAAPEPRVLAFRMLPSPVRAMGGIKVFGVALLDPPSDTAAYVDRTVSPAEALRRAVMQTGETIADVVRGFSLFFTGTVGVTALSGPIAIAKMSDEAAHAGAAQYIEAMALISANLGVINLLPIPVLDGGHLLFFVIELFTRRRVSAATRAKATIVGLGLVGLLMVVAISNDVIGLFHP
jgi:regulator of sigma E protease